MTTAKIAIVKKLSAKTLVGIVKSYAKDLQPGQSIDLFKVVGVASGLKVGTSNYGEWTALMGQFVAEALVGAKAGQRFRTGQMFLPDVALNMVAPVVGNLGKGDSVELAFTVGIQHDDDSSTGYIYDASFLIEPKENDPLEALLAKALPAPAKTETPAKTTTKA